MLILLSSLNCTCIFFSDENALYAGLIIKNMQYFLLKCHGCQTTNQYLPKMYNTCATGFYILNKICQIIANVRALEKIYDQYTS